MTVDSLPKVEDLKESRLPISSKILDRNGVVLYTVYRDVKRTPIELKDIPVHVKLAILAAEDADFYSHNGVSPKAILRAIYIYSQGGKLTGGSTITQQLVKYRLLTSEKTFERKAKEAYLAIQAEKHYSKEEILELYVNSTPFGGPIYGIKEAAKTYFNKNVQDLSIGEAALLASLPKSPTRLSPHGVNRIDAIRRQRDVIDNMVAKNFITKAIGDKAKNEPLKFATTKNEITAPHFVMYVKSNLEKNLGEETVQMGGLEVRTTLDENIQALAEQAVKDEIEKLKNYHVENGAALVLSVKTGEILAMVGSKDFFGADIDGKVNVILSSRPPGSSIKLVTYALAFSKGLSPNTKVLDAPKTFKVEGQPPYIPKNYDGKFRGEITLRSALAESRNIPAVKLLEYLGVENMIDMGKKMGITSWDKPQNYGLSLTLGGGEVTPLELARTYLTIANYGIKKDLVSIKEVKNSDGNLVASPHCRDSACDPDEKALDDRVAYTLIDILKDNRARTPAFGARSALIIPRHPEVVVKTGTSNDLRDNWAVGFNQDYLVLVWVGNNDNSPMSRVASGITGATPIWNKIMTSLLADREAVAWDVPADLKWENAFAFDDSISRFKVINN